MHFRGKSILKFLLICFMWDRYIKFLGYERLEWLQCYIYPNADSFRNILNKSPFTLKMNNSLQLPHYCWQSFIIFVTLIIIIYQSPLFKSSFEIFYILILPIHYSKNRPFVCTRVNWKFFKRFSFFNNS